MSGRPDSSSNLQILETDVPEDLTLGWQAPVVAERQEAAFEEVLQAMRRGKVREDFAALAAAVKATALKDPLIIEVGSGSGWNHSVLEFLLKQNFRYIGMDYSQSMVALGRRAHPADLFVIGDAAALPFASDCCDVLILGTVLMHVLGYREAVQESRRVARNCCIFHTIPVVEKRKTTLIRKNAYGVPVVEITFSEREFIDLLSKNGFRVRETFQSVPHPYLEKLYGEAVHTRTYLCEC
ncbi:MAG TPA: methyltransferase domain-containing protein [Terriglobia bacterium]|nr:methyltransferase domain-containing protein [Terriglobia bacterium]